MCFFAIFLYTSYGILVLYLVPVISDLASIQNWPLYVQTNMVYICGLFTHNIYYDSNLESCEQSAMWYCVSRIPITNYLRECVKLVLVIALACPYMQNAKVMLKQR